MILEIIIPPNPSLRTMEPRRFILALVSDCKTDGKDAAKDTVTFTKIGPCAVVDLAAICAVVGCFKYGSVEEKWAIVDRSTDYARTDFKEDDVELSDDED
jgi:hypothetical protein